MKKSLIIFVYNLLFPAAFIFFLPGMICKLIRRDGEKKNFAERFALFSRKKIKALSALKKPVVWIHSVSVGETRLAVDFIKSWEKKRSDVSFVISTTTTTGQAVAASANLPETVVIFCPIDFILFVRRALKLIRPRILIIIETEIWPNLINECHKRGIGIAQINARISDRSFKGYYRFRKLIGPILSMADISCAQTDVDADRLRQICGSLNVVKTGTMKFDQAIPADIKDVNLREVFGEGDFTTLLLASSHPGEERLVSKIYLNLLGKFPLLRLIIIPRHAERGSEISSTLADLNVSYHRRSRGGKPDSFVMCLLADTTGEMLSFMRVADVVIMGKSFAGNTGGHNIIEPALLGKPVITGKNLSNFRFALAAMLKDEAVVSVGDSELESAIASLVEDKNARARLGIRAKNAVMKHAGAAEKTIEEAEKLLGQKA